MTYEEAAFLSIRLDEIEEALDQDLPQDVVLNLITELNSILNFLEKANLIKEFKRKGFSLIRGKEGE